MSLSLLVKRRAAALSLALALLLLGAPLAATAHAQRHAESTAAAARSLTPQITLSPGAAAPGGMVGVSGANFQPGETVNVGIDLQPLVNVATAADGTISTTVTIPLNMTLGKHIIYALGLVGKGAAAAPLTVLALKPALSLNGSAFDVGREACAAGAGFGSHEAVVVQVNGGNVAFGQADDAGAFTICFNMPASIASGANTVTARGLQTGQSSTTTFTGVLPLSTTYYFTGGSTLDGNTTELPLFNPGALRARVVVTVYTRTQTRQLHAMVLQPHTRMTLDVGATGGRDTTIGARVQADQAIAAQLVVHRGPNAPYSLVGATAPSDIWYFAEGYSGGTFHTFLHVLNPLRAKAVVAVKTIPTAGKTHTLYYTMPGQRVATLDLNRLSPHASFATVVSSVSPVVVARVMTYGPLGGAEAYGANAATGLPAPRTSWDFVNGSAAPGAATYLLAYNPSGSRTASLSLKFYSSFGVRLFLHTERIAPHSRLTLRLSDLIGASTGITGTGGISGTSGISGTNPFSGTSLIAAATGSIDTIASSSAPLILEQSSYDGDPNQGHTAGAVLAPTTATATTWTFATGDTSTGAREALTIFNPNMLPINVTATFAFTGSVTKSFQVPVAALSQASIDPGPLGYNLAAAPHGVQLSTILFPFSVIQSLYPPGTSAPYTTLGIPK